MRRWQPAPAQPLPELIERTGVPGGVILHVGCGDGRVTASLSSSGRFLVRGLNRDAAAIQSASRHVHDLAHVCQLSRD